MSIDEKDVTALDGCAAIDIGLGKAIGKSGSVEARDVTQFANRRLSGGAGGLAILAGISNRGTK